MGKSSYKTAKDYDDYDDYDNHDDNDNDNSSVVYDSDEESSLLNNNKESKKSKESEYNKIEYKFYNFKEFVGLVKKIIIDTKLFIINKYHDIKIYLSKRKYKIIPSTDTNVPNIPMSNNEIYV